MTTEKRRERMNGEVAEGRGRTDKNQDKNSNG